MPSLQHILLFAAVAFLLFGTSFKFSDMMGDVAKGIKSFKKGLQEEDTPSATATDPLKTLDHAPQAEVETKSKEKVG